MPEPALMNDDAARSPTGEILDQTAPTPTPDPTDTSTTKTETKTETTETPDGDTLLTKPTDKPADAKDTKATEGVPETYADFKLPDGLALDAKAVEAATPIFKELGLSQDQAQKLVEFHAKQMLEAAKGPEATYQQTRSKWQADTLADADIKAYATDGKTGIDAVKVDIGRALATLDPGLVKDFKAAMDLTGVGDNPAFVKAFWKMSQSLIEGKHVTGRGPSPEGQRAPGSANRPSPAQALYPNNP